MNAKGGYIYIVSNKLRTVVYIGVTSNLHTRIHQHRNGEGSVFTKKYNCTDLLYFEYYQSIEEAILREKQMKKWKREWKMNLILKENPQLKDLSGSIEDYV